MRRFNTMIRLYWSDAFQSGYLSEPTTAFLNLLIPAVFIQSFHYSNHPSWTSAQIEIHSHKTRIAHVLFLTLLSFVSVSIFAVCSLIWLLSVSVKFDRCQPRLFLTVHHSSQTSQSCTHRHPGQKNWTTQSLPKHFRYLAADSSGEISASLMTC